MAMYNVLAVVPTDTDYIGTAAEDAETVLRVRFGLKLAIVVCLLLSVCYLRTSQARLRGRPRLWPSS